MWHEMTFHVTWRHVMWFMIVWYFDFFSSNAWRRIESKKKQFSICTGSTLENSWTLQKCSNVQPVKGSFHIVSATFRAKNASPSQNLLKLSTKLEVYERYLKQTWHPQKPLQRLRKCALKFPPPGHTRHFKKIAVSLFSKILIQFFFHLVSID